MKKKELSDLRKKDIKELKKMTTDKKHDLAKTLTELAVGKEKNLKKAKNLRLDIARIATIIQEADIVTGKQSKIGKEKVGNEI